MAQLRIGRIVFLLLFVLIIIYIWANISVFWPKIMRLLGVTDFGYATVEIIHIIDGDTIQVLDDGTVKTIRLIGFDAAEAGGGQAFYDCMAGKSVEKLNSYFSESRVVRLGIDENVGDKDESQRYLRYVVLDDGTDLALDMIREGYGREMTVQQYSKLEDYKDAENEAKSAGKGLWGEDGC